MSMFEIHVGQVVCRPEHDLCRTVRYAAEQFGLQLEQITCATTETLFHAQLHGRRLGVERVADVIRESFPDAVISVHEVVPVRR